MTSFKPGKEPSVELVGGPMPFVMSCVSLRLRSAKYEFAALMMADRTVYVAEGVELSFRHAASKFASQFDKDHRILIHELLKRARENINVGAIPAFAVAIIEPPTLSRAGELVFRMALNEAELILHVSYSLTPCQLHLNQGDYCELGQLFAAYDMALDYMQEHTEYIEDLGFDTTVLRMSMRDWQSYKERMRVTEFPRQDLKKSKPS